MTDLLGKLQLANHPSAKSLMQAMASQQATADTSTTGRVLAGAGKAFTDIARGAGQIVGLEPQSAIDEAAARDRALMQTKAGLAGNIGGNIAAFAPTMFIPGANTYTGAALSGGLMGALQPVSSDQKSIIPGVSPRAFNIGLASAGGVAGQALGRGIGRLISPVESRLSPEKAALAQAAQNEGIPLTAGQQTGSKPLQTVESVMENLPFTSRSQLAGREAQQRAFTAAALKRAGIQSDVADAATLAQQKASLGNTFQQIAGRNVIDLNQGNALTSLANIQNEASRRLSNPAPIVNTIDDILNDAQQGVLPGAKYQGWRDTLRVMSRGNDTEAHYAAQIKMALDNAFTSQAQGADAQAWNEASRQYANLKTLMDAAGGAGNPAALGQIAPSQLSGALTRAVSKEGKALGRGDLNQLSRIGQVFVRDTLPDSHTAQRQFYINLLRGQLGGAIPGAGIGYYEGGPQGAAVGAAAGSLGALALPKATQALMNSPAGQAYLTSTALTPAARNALANTLRMMAVGGTASLESPQ